MQNAGNWIAHSSDARANKGNCFSSGFQLPADKWFDGLIEAIEQSKHFL
jgi:hypothetical protein